MPRRVRMLNFISTPVLTLEPCRLPKTLRKIFDYLYSLSSSLRHPSEWWDVSFQTIDCSASCLLYAYALYVTSISLRRNASRSPREKFEETHNTIFSALARSQSLCSRVSPTEITWLLRDGMDDELEMTTSGPSSFPHPSLESDLHSLQALLSSKDSTN